MPLVSYAWTRVLPSRLRLAKMGLRAAALQGCWEQKQESIWPSTQQGLRDLQRSPLSQEVTEESFSATDLAEAQRRDALVGQATQRGDWLTRAETVNWMRHHLQMHKECGSNDSHNTSPNQGRGRERDGQNPASLSATTHMRWRGKENRGAGRCDDKRTRQCGDPDADEDSTDLGNQGRLMTELSLKESDGTYMKVSPVTEEQQIDGMKKNIRSFKNEIAIVFSDLEGKLKKSTALSLLSKVFCFSPVGAPLILPS